MGWPRLARKTASARRNSFGSPSMSGSRAGNGSRSNYILSSTRPTQQVWRDDSSEQQQKGGSRASKGCREERPKGYIMSEATVTFVSNGWFFAEDSADHSSIFIHQKEVENQRYLKVNDRVSFDRIPSTKYPGKLQATNVKYLGHTIARQVSDKAVQS